MKLLKTKIKVTADGHGYITTKVTFCGNGTWLLQEYEQDGRATGAVSCHREEFDISSEDEDISLFNVFCYRPVLINPQRNFCVAKDKMDTRLRVNTVVAAAFNHSGSIGLSVEGEPRIYSFRLNAGDYLVLAPVIKE